MKNIISAPFPAARLRRTRAQPWLRELVRETRLHPSDFILPLFVQEGEEETPVPSLPGVSRLPIGGIIRQAQAAKAAGIPAIALFPVTPAERKSPGGEEAVNPDNLISRAIRAVKAAVPGIGIIADVALDPYTSHGHDGVLDASGQVDNDLTVDLLCGQALTLARAGADIVAPSDMMDGRVGAIRAVLEMDGFSQVLILAYSAKYASSLYGPFRDAVGSAQNLGKADKRGYQMDPANAEEALREAAMDISEGADLLMVKPALPYLDVIRSVSETFGVPTFAYQVSGEYAMCMSAADPVSALMESLLCIRRAGARAIFTYGALLAARALRENSW